MQRENQSSELGSEELEKGMRPGRMRDVAGIGLIALAMLLIVNSGGLAKWTQTLPSSATNAWLSECASDWHELMTKIGPSAAFERVREFVRPE